MTGHAKDWDADCFMLAEFHEKLGPVAHWAVPDFGTVLPDGTRTISKDVLRPLVYSVMSVDFQNDLNALLAFKYNTIIMHQCPADKTGYISVQFALLDIRARAYWRPFALVYVSREPDQLSLNYSRIASSLLYAVNMLKRANRVSLLMQKPLVNGILEQQLENEKEPGCVDKGTFYFGVSACELHLQWLNRIDNTLRCIPDSELPIDGIPVQLRQNLDELIDEFSEINSTRSDDPFEEVQRMWGSETPTIEKLCGKCTIARVRAYFKTLCSDLSVPIPLSVLHEDQKPLFELLPHSLLTIGDAVSQSFALDISKANPIKDDMLRKDGPVSPVFSFGVPKLPLFEHNSSQTNMPRSNSNSPGTQPAKGFKVEEEAKNKRSMSLALFSPPSRPRRLENVSNESGSNLSSPTSSPWVERVCDMLESSAPCSPRACMPDNKSPSVPTLLSKTTSALLCAVDGKDDGGDEDDEEEEEEVVVDEGEIGDKDNDRLCASEPTQQDEQGAKSESVDKDKEADSLEERISRIVVPQESSFRAASNICYCDSIPLDGGKVGNKTTGKTATAGNTTTAALAAEAAADEEKVPRFVTFNSFLRMCSFSEHLIYSLLRGRPVIVYGPEPKCVRAVVKLLSVFVVGNSQNSIIELAEKPIRLYDLVNLRLVGIVPRRGLQVSGHLVQFVSILKVNENGVPLSLNAPPYPVGNDGGVIGLILARNLLWLDDTSFASHVHEILFSLSIKAFLYYHMCCAGVGYFEKFHVAKFFKFPAGSEDALLSDDQSDRLPVSHSKSPSMLWRRRKESSQVNHASRVSDSDIVNLDPSRLSVLPMEAPENGSLADCLKKAMNTNEAVMQPIYSTEPLRSSVRESYVNEFFKHYNINPGDREIIQFLAEVVKMQQFVSGSSPSYVQPIKLDSRPCHQFTARSVVAANK